MTQADLDALPEVTGVALYQPDEISVRDAYGVRWMLGYYEGVKVKSRHGAPQFSVRVLPDGTRQAFMPTPGFVRKEPV